MRYALQAYGAPSIHPSVMSRHRRWNALRGAMSVMNSLQAESNGLAFDFTQSTPQLIIRDTTTPANNFSGNFNTKVTSAYASTKRILNGAGSYEAVTVPTPEYNSSGAVLGIPFEGARTNEIRNNSMQGAVAGTPGTLPTNWSSTAASGLTVVSSLVTVNGIECVRYAVSGTTGDTNGFFVNFETTTQIVASTGQAWAISAFMSLDAGGFSNVTVARLVLSERTAAGAAVISTNGTDIKSSLNSTQARVSFNGTLAGGGTVARVQPRFEFGIASGVAVNFTVTIGWPQIEQAAFASSPIRTTSAAVTRSADNASLAVANFPSMAAGGHMVASWIPGQVDAAQFGNVLRLNQDNNNHTSIANSTAQKRAYNIIASASAPSLTPTGTLAIGTQTTVAYSFAVNNYDAASDGGAIQSSASGAALPTYAHICFGGRNSTAGEIAGWLRKGKIVPRTLTDAEVVTLSTLT